MLRFFYLDHLLFLAEGEQKSSLGSLLAETFGETYLSRETPKGLKGILWIDNSFLSSTETAKEVEDFLEIVSNGETVPEGVRRDPILFYRSGGVPVKRKLSWSPARMEPELLQQIDWLKKFSIAGEREVFKEALKTEMKSSDRTLAFLNNGFKQRNL